MDSDEPERDGAAAAGLRERIGQRAWVRSAALVGGGLIAGGIIAGTVTANAADEGSRPRTPPPVSTTVGGTTDRGATATRPSRSGTTRSCSPATPPTQVTEAVLAEYPDATIERVETDSDGVYEAHIVTTDDERLTVAVDEDFAITGTEGD